MENGTKIVVFCCNWCSYAGADVAGTMRLKLPPNFRIIRVMCSGRVNFLMVLWSLLKGADGVLVTGCHPGDCHYIAGNEKARKRMDLLEEVLGFYGLRQRVAMEYISASEPQRFRDVVRGFLDTVSALGPSPLRTIDALESPKLGNDRMTRKEIIRLFLALKDALSIEIADDAIVSVDELAPGFGKPQFDAERCLGCGACSRSCPMDNITIDDQGTQRHINYFHSSCVACGTCEDVCQADAIRISRTLDLKTFLEWTKLDGAELMLKCCSKCGRPYVPERHLRKVADDLSDHGLNLPPAELCDECRCSAIALQAKAVYSRMARALR